MKKGDGSVREGGESSAGRSGVGCTKEMGKLLSWGVRGLAGCCVGHRLERSKAHAGNPSRNEAWTRETAMGSKEGAPLGTLRGRCRVGCLQGRLPSTRFHSPFGADPGLDLVVVPTRRSSASAQAPWKDGEGSASLQVWVVVLMAVDFYWVPRCSCW